MQGLSLNQLVRGPEAAGNWPAPRRLRCYIVLALLCLAAAIGAGLVRAVTRGVPMEYAVSDAQGYYVYLPALLIHHSLDIEPSLLDQVRLDQQGEKSPPPVELPHGFHRDQQGRAIDRYPCGLAITLAPGFLLAHAASIQASKLTGSALFVPNGYTLLYQLAALLSAMAAGLIGMILTDRFIEERFDLSGKSILTGVLLYWLGSNYLYYFVREPLMAHVISCAWASATVYLAHRVMADGELGQFHLGHWLGVSFCFAMALACRYTNLFLFPLIALALLYGVTRRPALSQLGAMICLLVGMAPMGAQLLLVRATVGAWHSGVNDLGYDSYESFMWTKPLFAQTLFSACHGLFTWSPILLGAIPGIVVLLYRRQQLPLMIALLLSAAALWYVNSAWSDWWFGFAFGGRAFIELAPLFILGLAASCDLLYKASRAWMRLAVATATVCFLVSYGLMGLYMAHIIPRSDYPGALATAAAERNHMREVPTVAVPRYWFLHPPIEGEARGPDVPDYP